MNNFSSKVFAWNVIATVLAFTFTMMLFGCRMNSNYKIRAIVAFTETEEVGEDWSWFFSDIEKACEPFDIAVVYIPPYQDTISIKGPEGSETVDISDFRKYHRGYLFITPNKPIQYQPYNQSYLALENASIYFGLNLKR